MKRRAIGFVSVVGSVSLRGIRLFSGGQIFVAHVRQNPHRKIQRRFGGKLHGYSVSYSCVLRLVWRFFYQPQVLNVGVLSCFFYLKLETKRCWLVGANEKRMKIHPFSRDAGCDQSDKPRLKPTSAYDPEHGAH